MTECTDKKCPIHGHVKTRGSTVIGTVKNSKTKYTALVIRDYLHFIPKYERYERRRTKINAHIPGCMNVKVGDKVKLRECRKLSKTKSFVITEILKK